MKENAEYPKWLRPDGCRRGEAKRMPDGITDQMLEWHATISIEEVSLCHSAPIKGLGMNRYCVVIESEYWGYGTSNSTSYEQAVQIVRSFIRNYNIPDKNIQWHNHTPDRIAQQYLFSNFEMENW